MLGYVGTRQLFWSGLSTALCRLGEISFSVYLLHRPILEALAGRPYLLLHPTGNWAQDVLINTVAVALPATLAMSFVTYRTIELPFLSLRRRYITNGTAASAA